MPASISFMSGVACYSKKSGPRIVIGDKPVCIIMSSIRDVGDGWAGWSIAHPGFGRSVNPIISTKGQLKQNSWQYFVAFSENLKTLQICSEII